MRVLLQIEYDGTNYHGWQLQKNGVSVQQTLQECLQGILCQPITLVASGRTDSGVHAKNQYAHFDYDGKFDVKKLPYALQGSLPNDISVKNAWVVSDDFHARYSVKFKTYHYCLYVGDSIQPLKERYRVYLKHKPNLQLMKKASKYLVGIHDFSSFCVPRKIENENNTRTIKNIKICKKNECITLKICGNGFLHNMVRIIAGTLLDVGFGKISPKQIKTILEQKDRTKAGKTAPAKGLVLYNVDYGIRFK